MKTTQLFILLTALLTIASMSANAAYRPIIRSFHSVRTAGMGDVRYTVGEYEENLFANPARMTDLPGRRIQLPKISLEAGSAAISTLGTLLKSSDQGLSAASDAVGKPISARFQLIFPGAYFPKFINDDWAFGAALAVSASTSAIVSQTGYIDPLTVIDVGPAFTVARRLLPEDRLSVGATMHLEERATSNSVFSVRDFLAGTNVADAIKGGSGMGVDFDLGATFKPEWHLGEFDYELGFAINNLLNGMYKGGGKLSDWQGDPTPSNRSYNLGVSATRKNWGAFHQVLFALETTDIGNNPGGSVFRTLHLGSEVRWAKLAGRLGLNQGYIAAGIGLDLGYFDFNLATYGEEMGLNAGTLEDRRYALEFGFHI